MRRKKQANYPSQQKSRANLDGPQATSNTHSREQESTNYNTESVEPPFEGERDNRFLRMSDVLPALKVLGIWSPIILTAGSILWWASGLDKDVEILTKDVGEIKVKTDTLLEGSIRSDERLKSAEKVITAIAERLQTQQDNPNIQSPSTNKSEP